MPTKQQIAEFLNACRINLPAEGLAYYGRCVHLMPDGRVLVDTKAYAEQRSDGSIVRPVVSAKNIPENGSTTVVNYLAGNDSGWWTL